MPNFKYKVFKEYGTDAPTLGVLEIEKEGKKLRLKDRHQAVGYKIVIDAFEVSDTPREALEEYRQSLSFRLQSAHAQVLSIQKLLDATPEEPTDLKQS